MKKILSLPIISLFILGLFSCTSRTKKSVPQLQESDSANVEASSHPITDMLYAELDSADVYNDSILYGYWFKPHEASAVNIFFHKDGRFEFKYYIIQEDSVIDVVKKGTFTIGDMDASQTRIVKMQTDDGWDEKVFKGTVQYNNNGTNFYISDEESGLYLVKGSD